MRIGRCCSGILRSLQGRRGGLMSNVAIAHVRLGGRATFIGKVGSDEFGMELVLMMNKEKVQTRGVKFDVEAKTGHAYMKVRFEDGKMKMEMVKDAPKDSFFDLNMSLPLSKSRDETKELIKEAWNQADIVEVSRQELEFLLDEEYFERKRNYKPQYYSENFEQTKARRDYYHYKREVHLITVSGDYKLMFQYGDETNGFSS